MRGFAVTLKSFLSYNSWFNHDLVIIDAGLTDKQRAEITEHYPKTSFTKPRNAYHSTPFDRTPQRLRQTYFTLEAFRLTEYDRVVFLDCDLVIKGDISEIFNQSAQFSAVRCYQRSADRLVNEFNSGVFVVNKPAISEAVYSSLIALSHVGKNSPDQNILNKYFYGGVNYLPKEYNVEKRLLESPRHRDMIDCAKILHFVGEKPWQQHAEGSREAKYTGLETIWHQWEKAPWPK